MINSIKICRTRNFFSFSFENETIDNDDKHWHYWWDVFIVIEQKKIKIKSLIFSARFHRFIVQWSWKIHSVHWRSSSSLIFIFSFVFFRNINEIKIKMSFFFSLSFYFSNRSDNRNVERQSNESHSGFYQSINEIRVLICLFFLLRTKEMIEVQTSQFVDERSSFMFDIESLITKIF